MEKIRQHSFKDETYQIGIDFDGVIHKNSVNLGVVKKI